MSASQLKQLLDKGFANPSAPAIKEGKQSFTYAELQQAILALNSYLTFHYNGQALKIGVLTSRSALAYACVLLSVKTGNTFVALNPAFPPQNLRKIVELSGINLVFSYQKHLPVFEAMSCPANIKLYSIESFDDLLAQGKNLNPEALQKNFANPAASIVYELFTSGTTGVPKGVPVSYHSLVSYIHNLHRLFPVKAQDICSQTFELNFDVSIHDIFLCFTAGACLVPASDMDLLMPVHYIGKHKISVWFSVPSTANIVRNTKKIDVQQFKSLRLSQFAGEQLTQGLANCWLGYAPQSTLVNLYGPTECTITILWRVWKANDTINSDNLTVPIGKIFEGHQAAVLNEQFHDQRTLDATNNVSGELLLSGPQVFAGYLNKDVASPFYQGADGKTYYRTGDLVTYQDGEFIHQGRIDDQVKIRGFRIELGDVEAKLKKYYNHEDIIVVTDKKQNPQNLVALLGESLNNADFKTPDAKQAGLPAYMMPAQFIFVPPFFKNNSGKVDRKRMAETYLSDYHK